MLIFVRIAVYVVRMVNKSTDFIGSFAKGLRVIEAFGAEHPRLSIAEVAARAGLDRATARRCLLTLTELGYADYDGKFFTLTARILRLGMGALAGMPLAQMVQPWLDQLSEKVGQSASLAILDETEIVYLARAAQQRVMSIGLMPGSRLPAHCTSMGRVLLAALPEGEARGLVERADLTPRTPRALTDPGEIMDRIAEVRRQGFAVIDQEVELGLIAIAVPIENAHGHVVAALNIGMSAAHGSPESMAETFLPHLAQVQGGLRRILR